MNCHQNIHASNQLLQPTQILFVLNGTVLDHCVYHVQKVHFSTVKGFVKDLILCANHQIKLMDIVQVAMMDMKLISMENVCPPPRKESVIHFVHNLPTMFVQNALQAHTLIKKMSVNPLTLTALNLIPMIKNASNVIQVTLSFLANAKLIRHILLTILIVQNFQTESVLCVQLDTISRKMENVQLLIHYVRLSIKWMDNAKAVLLVMLYNLVSVYHFKTLLKIPTVPLLILIIPVKNVRKDFSLMSNQIYVSFQTHCAKLLMI